MRLLGILTVIVLSLAAAPVAPAGAAAPYAPIEGSGSTSVELLLQQWIADVDANGIKVTYTGGGSSKGRRDFAQVSTDFAITDIPYQGVGETGQSDTSEGREFAYVPVVAGGTAFTYHLEVDGRLVRNLRLSGETVAKIFTNQITDWSDPAIRRDNNGRRFPSLPITPVVRADGSGSTVQLTSWMDAMHPEIWEPYYGQAGSTAYYPRKSGSRMIGQSGSDAVVNTIKGPAGNGAIGYVENTYAAMADYPVAALRNQAGYYVEPTAYDVAIALTGAEQDEDGVADLAGVWASPDERAYQISSYSYLILPTGADDPRMTTAKRQTLVDFSYYSRCAGQTKAAPYGYAPLPLNLVQAGFDQVAKLQEADPDVDLTDREARTCDNPTFDGLHLDRDVLGEKAPMPEACAKDGAGPCGTTGPVTNKQRPSIIGRARVGRQVSADVGRWSGESGYRYQWLADGEPIAGARRATYRIAASLRGELLRVKVTATSEDFAARSVSSAGRRVRASG